MKQLIALALLGWTVCFAASGAVAQQSDDPLPQYTLSPNGQVEIEGYIGSIEVRPEQSGPNSGTIWARDASGFLWRLQFCFDTPEANLRRAFFLIQHQDVPVKIRFDAQTFCYSSLDLPYSSYDTPAIEQAEKNGELPEITRTFSSIENVEAYVAQREAVLAQQAEPQPPQNTQPPAAPAPSQLQPFTLRCRRQEVVVGLSGKLSPQGLSRIAIRCQSTDGRRLIGRASWRGGAGSERGRDFQMNCPEGQVLSGLADIRTSRGGVTGFTPFCKPLTARGQGRPQQPIGERRGRLAPSQSCPGGGGFFAGLRGAADQVIRRLEAVCR